jgi:predicted nucleic acid-binding protein
MGAPAVRAVVLDASVCLAWCIADEADPYADRVLGGLEEVGALVPPVWTYEIADALHVATRRARLSTELRGRYLQMLTSLPITVGDLPLIGSIPALVGICERHGLAAYDAAYLHLALAARAPLATLDLKLRAAARQAGVASFQP